MTCEVHCQAGGGERTRFSAIVSHQCTILSSFVFYYVSNTSIVDDKKKRRRNVRRISFFLSFSCELTWACWYRKKIISFVVGRKYFGSMRIFFLSLWENVDQHHGEKEKKKKEKERKEKKKRLERENNEREEEGTITPSDQSHISQQMQEESISFFFLLLFFPLKDNRFIVFVHI